MNEKEEIIEELKADLSRAEKNLQNAENLARSRQSKVNELYDENLALKKKMRSLKDDQ